MFTLSEKYEQGVAAKEPNDVYRFITVDLNTIKFNPPAARDWLGVSKPYSPEDTFMMSQAQPVTHGYIVKNEYFIAIRTEYDGCTCCTDTPTARVPLTILPEVNPNCYGFQPPANFQPMVVVPVYVVPSV